MLRRRAHAPAARRQRDEERLVGRDCGPVSDRDRRLGRRRGGNRDRLRRAARNGGRPHHRQDAARAALRRVDQLRGGRVAAEFRHVVHPPLQQRHQWRQRESRHWRLGHRPRRVRLRYRRHPGVGDDRSTGRELDHARRRDRGLHHPRQRVLARPAADQRPPAHRARHRLQLAPVPRARAVCRAGAVALAGRGIYRLLRVDHRPRRPHRGVQAAPAAARPAVRHFLPAQPGDLRARGDRGARRRAGLAQQRRHRPVRPGRMGGREPDGVEPDRRLLGLRREVSRQSPALHRRGARHLHEGARRPDRSDPHAAGRSPRQPRQQPDQLGRRRQRAA